MGDLTQLQVGDCVFTQIRYSGSIQLHKITKITKTQIICGNWRFSRKTGELLPRQTYCSMYAHLPTTEIWQTYRKQQLKKDLNELGNTISITDKNYNAIRGIVDKLLKVGGAQ